MTKWLRRIRGAIGMGLAWAIAWFGAGIALLIAGARADVPFPIFFALLGFLAGVTFSGLLGMVEGRRRFDQMSLPRFAGWGGGGGLVLSVALSAIVGWDALLVLAPVFALAGAGCAAGSLALARKAEDRELLDAAGDVDDAGLTEDEVRELLGDGS
jgi:hypothetical protein